MGRYWIAVRIAAIASLCSIAIALAGCGAPDDDSGSYTPLTPLCTYPNGITPQMIYPEPNATGVPDNLQIFVLADINVGTYNSGGYLLEFSTKNHVAQAANNSTSDNFSNFQQITQSQVPTPSAAITLANTIYIAATPAQQAVSALQPHTTYYAYLGGGSGPDCSANGPIGSFTTT